MFNKDLLQELPRECSSSGMAFHVSCADDFSVSPQMRACVCVCVEMLGETLAPETSPSMTASAGSEKPDQLVIGETISASSCSLINSTD